MLKIIRILLYLLVAIFYIALLGYLSVSEFLGSPFLPKAILQVIFLSTLALSVISIFAAIKSYKWEKIVTALLILMIVILVVLRLINL